MCDETYQRLKQLYIVGNNSFHRIMHEFNQYLFLERDKYWDLLNKINYFNFLCCAKN